MPLVTESSLRGLAKGKAILKAANTILKEHAATTAKRDSFDVFLSHSFKDADLVLGVKLMLEGRNLSVYVDWIEDSEIERERVSSATAEILRLRMNQSKSLVYAHSTNSPTSKWMPWEIGFFDGRKGAVVILPVAKNADETFKGQEFLGLYPYIDLSLEGGLWVNRGTSPKAMLGAQSPYDDFRQFNDWMYVRAGVRI
jgi:hypothetical protein